MKKVLLMLTLTSAIVVGFTSCKDYDDSEIRSELSDHEQRISALEEWQKTVNQNISSLQTIVSALEQKDYVTSVTKLSDGTGYTLTFQNSGDVTIKNGTDGHSPVIGVKQGTDGKYYWTLDGEYILDGGSSLPVTGADGKDGTDGTNGTDGKDAIAPQVRINDTSNEWEISTDGGKSWASTGVKATGEKGENGQDGDDGDSFFKSVKTSATDVTLILTDGTAIVIPLANALIGFDDYNLFTVSSTNRTVNVTFNGLTEDIYNALIAELVNEDGTTDRNILTRAAGDVVIAEPVFTNGTCTGTTVTINKQVSNGAKSILRVTLVDNEGQEYTISRPVKFELTASALMEEAKTKGQTIYLDESTTYKMPTEIAEGVTFVGNGATMTTTAGQTLSTSNVTFSNVTLSCESGSKETDAIMTVTGTNVTFDNVQVDVTSTEYGIEVNNNASVTIKNSSFDQMSFSRAVYANGNADVTLEGCDFSANLTYAYNGSGKLTAKDCTFRGWVSGWSFGGTFENCTFEYGNSWYPCAVCYGTTIFKNCTFGKYGYPYLDKDSKHLSAKPNTTYGFDYWVSCGTANITITFTGCKYSDGNTFNTDIFIRNTGDGKKDPGKVVIDGKEYTDITGTFRNDS